MEERRRRDARDRRVPPGAALDAFAWRVSVADVGTAGPFSRFDGIDRTLVLLSGAGMTLAEAGGARHVLDAPLARADFAGKRRSTRRCTTARRATST